MDRQMALRTSEVSQRLAELAKGEQRLAGMLRVYSEKQTRMSLDLLDRVDYFAVMVAARLLGMSDSEIESCINLGRRTGRSLREAIE